MSFPCAVSADLYRHQANVDQDSLWDLAEEARALELMEKGESCYPFTSSNFSESLGWIDIDPIADLLSAGNEARAGQFLAQLARNYWLVQAKEAAAKEIAHRRAHACHRCGGRGCPRCEEP